MTPVPRQQPLDAFNADDYVPGAQSPMLQHRPSHLVFSCCTRAQDAFNADDYALPPLASAKPRPAPGSSANSEAVEARARAARLAKAASPSPLVDLSATAVKAYARTVLGVFLADRPEALEEGQDPLSVDVFIQVCVASGPHAPSRQAE